MNDDICIVIPTIPPRHALLLRALASVQAQRRAVAAISVAQDIRREGAWTTRNRALEAVTTEWTGFLDDDDELLSHHTEFLLDKATEHGLDMVWGWFRVIGGVDPFPMHQGRQYDITTPHIVPISYIVRTELLHEAVAAMGGFKPDGIGAWDNQDQPLFDAMARLGKHMAFPDITWHWHHHTSNTSGLPQRWPGRPMFAEVGE